MKKLLLVFSLAQLTVIAFPQTTEPYKYLGNYTQPAPNAAALGKYADYPVSYYTGLPSIGVPLYNLQYGAVKVPISLSYHASGIRVSELASWVGLGWALNCGGMIIRSVRGAPDEGAWNATSSPRGYFLDYGISLLPMLPYPVNGVVPWNNTPNSSEIRSTFLTSLNAGKADCEPDLFTFNFNGYTGKFVFDENRIPTLLTEEDLKIAVSFNGTDFASWAITTPDGARYYFGENNVHEVNSIFSVGNQDNNSLRPASWQLTRIIYPNTKDTVYFDYTPETYSYYDLGQETRIFGDAYGGNQPLQTACYFGPADVPQNTYRTTVSGQRLTKIRSRNFNIAFGVRTTAGNERTDLVKGATNYPYKLDSLKVYNSQNQCIKQFTLGYDYFHSNPTTNLPQGGEGFMNSDSSDVRRLKLLSVTELSGDGLISKPAYRFTYMETRILPRRMSYDQDHWGYSNNYAGNANMRFTPAVSHTICTAYGGLTANRMPNTLNMQAFSIQTIKDPLGVTTTFELEAHTSTQGAPYDVVGGLRVHKITVTDSVTGKSTVRLFDYGNGGILSKIPEYLIFPQNEFYLQTGVFQTFPFSYRGYSYNNGLFIQSGIRQSQSVVPLQDFQGNHIGYPKVKEIFGLNGEGGYKIHCYMTDQLFGHNSRLDMSNYTAQVSVGTSYGVTTGIFGNGHFNDIPPQNLQYCSPSFTWALYPYAPDQVEFRRGQLLWEEVYDSTGKLIHSVRNNYTQTFHEDKLIRGFKIYRANLTFPLAQGMSNILNIDGLTYYKLRTGLSHLTSATIFDYKDGKSFTSVTTYKYESPYHTEKTGDSTINSTGDIIVNKTYYTFDYANTATADNVFGKLKARNMLLPVATRTWKNNQLLNGTVTLYKDFAAGAPDSFLYPSKIYALETVSPMTTVQAGENVAFTTAFTTLLPNTSFKEKASFNVSSTTGKIIEQKLVNDKSQALIWDNKLAMPLAQTDNALFSEVAYNSFETAETGNWTFAAGSVVSDATAPTGTKAYNIAGGISKNTLNASQKYILSYWLKSGGTATVTGGTQTNNISGRLLNGWTYKQVTITGTTTISISGSGNIDEVRLHPVMAQMTTYTYDALMRLVAQCSANNSISYYEYDSMNRVVDIKDQYGNVIKAFEYNYGRSSRPGN